MKIKLLLFIALFIFSVQVFSQGAYRNEISAKMIFNEATGQFLHDNEFKALIENNPQIVFKPVIDRYGHITSYIFNPSSKDVNSPRDTSDRVKKGEPFPSFTMKSIHGKEIDSEQLRGKITLIQFQLQFLKPFFDKQTIDDFNTLVQEINKTTEVEALIVTESSKEEIQKQLGDINYISEIIPDGRNFYEKYLVVHFPSAILIDKEGKLVSYFHKNQSTLIKAAIAKIK